MTQHRPRHLQKLCGDSRRGSHRRQVQHPLPHQQATLHATIPRNGVRLHLRTPPRPRQRTPRIKTPTWLNFSAEHRLHLTSRFPISPSLYWRHYRCVVAIFSRAFAATDTAGCWLLVAVAGRLSLVACRLSLVAVDFAAPSRLRASRAPQPCVAEEAPCLSAASLGAVPRMARSTGHRCGCIAPDRVRRQRFWLLLPRQK
ncbi:hypothetical protein XHC_3817 [Xanthomonas hortorum pv. carotae str. M081]|nr:hypothetical protein XHC_3817 [Xanthomonas hortorum pv. carotae str. M081]